MPGAASTWAVEDEDDIRIGDSGGDSPQALRAFPSALQPQLKRFASNASSDLESPDPPVAVAPVGSTQRDGGGGGRREQERREKEERFAQQCRATETPSPEPRRPQHPRASSMPAGIY